MLNRDRRKKRALGLAIGERSLLLAELAANGGGARVLRVCEFPYPAGASLERAAELGEALANFLREKEFSSRSVTIGIPAKWLVVKSHEVPAADADAAASMLALHTESQRSPELGEMIFDFAGNCDESHASTLLLMGLPRRWLDRAKTLADSAGLKILAITPGTAALGTATALSGGPGENPLVLSLRPGGAELVVHEGGQTRILRHLAAGASAMPLVAEINRVTATLQNGFASGNGHRPAVGGRGPRRLVVWDDIGLDPAALESLQSSLGMEVARGDLSALRSTGCALADGRVGASAIALALPALFGKRPAIDFLHPRIQPIVTRTPRRRAAILWTAGAAAAVVFGLGYTDLWRLESQVKQKKAALALLEPKVNAAKPFVASMGFVRGFDTRDPRHLACVRDVAVVVPKDGQTYLTNFHLIDAVKSDPNSRAIRGDSALMKGEVTGRAASNQDVITLVDKLKAVGRFASLNSRLDSHDARGAGPPVSFTLTFLYTPRK